MRAFEFRLQTKLDLTCRQEELAKEEVFLKQQVFNKEWELLNQLIEQREDLNNSLRNQSGQSLRIVELIIFKDFQKLLRELLNKQEARVNEAEKALDKARAALLEKVKERKTLEKLREKEFQEYRQEFVRIEQSLIDEVALGRFWRSKNSS